ncbi:MAG: polysaccharide biosynthesis C-terminal domain-containing protein [Bacteroidota bacterium]
MGNIRKQTIISSILVYIGFFIGFINNYFYTSTAPFGFKGANIFTPAQYALTQMFFNSSQIFFAFGALGVIPVVYKFYPYYKDNLEEKKIDLVSWALLISFIGFILVFCFGIFLEPYFVRIFSENSPLYAENYIWLFPLTAGTIFFSVAESFCWAVQRSVVSNFLKETFMRLVLTVLIVLYCCKVIDFQQFVIFFSFQFLLIFFILLVYLYRTKHLYFTLKISRVTRKFWKKMLSMQALIYSGTCIAMLASSIDILIIGGMIDMTQAGIYGFAFYLSNLIQVPQRSIQAVSASVLSRSWKDKNHREISRIYSRSSINLLLMSLFIFGNIWLNILPAIQVFKIQKAFTEGMGVFLVLGLVRIIDAGTGLSQMVINTSTYWRYDFFSRLVLLLLRLPLTFLLITNYGIIGSAFAELISYTVYTFIGYEFLRRKFKLQPFSFQTLYSLLLGTGAFALCFFTMNGVGGLLGLILRGGVFSALMIVGVFYWKLTPDAGQLYAVLLGRVDGFKNRRKKNIE